MQALVATVGSLFLSEVLKYPPCVLCWYQRICMYPLAIILAIGVLKKDTNVVWYAFPLAIIGFSIAFYHNLLYYKIIPESIQPCATGISCTTTYFAWFGFVTIPFLSLLAFSVILFLLVAYRRREKKLLIAS